MNASQKYLFRFFLLTLTTVIFFHSSIAKEDSVVNLYSARKQALIQPLLKAFTKETGIQVNIITSKADALMKRLQNESINSPADVLLTTDAGRLWRAQQAGLFRTVNSPILQKAIPEKYRDASSQWFGLSLRARPIMINTQFKGVIPLRYEELSKDIYKSEICIRSSNNIYNQSLIASMIAHLGKKETQKWAQKFVLNFSRKPQGGDRDQIRAASTGQCNIVIANTYYLAQMLDKNASEVDRNAAQKIRVIWPNQNDRGVHVNISGAGVLKHAKHPQNAIRFIEFLASDAAQRMYAEINHEFSVKPDVTTPSALQAWGEFNADTLHINKLGKHNASAVRIMDKAHWQ